METYHDRTITSSAHALDAQDPARTLFENLRLAGFSRQIMSLASSLCVLKTCSPAVAICITWAHFSCKNVHPESREKEGLRSMHPADFCAKLVQESKGKGQAPNGLVHVYASFVALAKIAEQNTALGWNERREGERDLRPPAEFPSFAQALSTALRFCCHALSR